MKRTTSEERLIRILSGYIPYIGLSVPEILGHFKKKASTQMTSWFRKVVSPVHGMGINTVFLAKSHIFAKSFQ